MDNITLFLNPVKEEKDWVFRVMRNGKVIKEVHSFTYDEAVKARGKYINKFWSNQLN